MKLFLASAAVMFTSAVSGATVEKPYELPSGESGLLGNTHVDDVSNCYDLDYDGCDEEADCWWRPAGPGWGPGWGTCEDRSGGGDNAPCNERSTHRWCTNGWGDFTCKWSNRRGTCREVVTNCDELDYYGCEENGDCKWRSDGPQVNQGKCVDSKSSSSGSSSESSSRDSHCDQIRDKKKRQECKSRKPSVDFNEEFARTEFD